MEIMKNYKNFPKLNSVQLFIFLIRIWKNFRIKNLKKLRKKKSLFQIFQISLAGYMNGGWHENFEKFEKFLKDIPNKDSQFSNVWKN